MIVCMTDASHSVQLVLDIDDSPEDLPPLTRQYGETDEDYASRRRYERVYQRIGELLAPFDAIDEMDFEEPEEYDR